MNRKPDISFIILNYNGIYHTRELLDSICIFLNNTSFEVIVVDNGSDNNEGELLSIEYPQFVFLISKTNLGFSGGNNLGIRNSIGRYIMLLNNDTLFIDNSVTKMVKYMDANIDVAAVSPKIYFVSPPNTIQFAGYTKLTNITLRNRAIGRNEIDRGQYDIPYETAYTHGAAMMVRREIMTEIGYMPEVYFLYYEEIDWCSKMRGSGYKIMYIPNSVIIHKESQSTGNDSYLKRYYMTRNRLLFVRRNRKGLVRLLAIIYLIFMAYPKLLFLSFIIGRRDLALATFKGVIDYFRLNAESTKY